MKIILIQPRTVSAALDYRFRGEHIGLSSLVAVLKKCGYEAVQFDDALDKRDLDETIKKIFAFKPDFIGVTVPAQQAAGTTIRYIREIKKSFPEIPLSIGGIYATVAYKEFMNRYSEIDYLMRGEGEETFPRLIASLEHVEDISNIPGISYRDEHGEIHHNPNCEIVRDISKLPPIDRSTITPLLEENRRVGIYSGRGCYGDCSFCSLHSFWNESCVRKRKPEQVVDEMVSLYELGAKKLRFIDDIFLDRTRKSREWLDEFEYLLSKEKTDFNLWMQFRAQDVDVDILRRLKKLGLRKMLIGIESGDQSSLDAMRKHTTVEENVLAMKRASEAGVKEVAMGFIMFHPDTTLESIYNNLDFLRSMQSIRYKNLFSRASAYEGTLMCNYITEEGLRKETANWYDVPTYRFKVPEIQILWDSIQKLKWSFSTMLWFESSLDVEERFIKGTKQRNSLTENLQANGEKYRLLLSDELIKRFFAILDNVSKGYANDDQIFRVPESPQNLMKLTEKCLFKTQQELNLKVGYHLPEEEKISLFEL